MPGATRHRGFQQATQSSLAKQKDRVFGFRLQDVRQGSRMPDPNREEAEMNKTSKEQLSEGQDDAHPISWMGTGGVMSALSLAKRHGEHVEQGSTQPLSPFAKSRRVLGDPVQDDGTDEL